MRIKASASPPSSSSSTSSAAPAQQESVSSTTASDVPAATGAAPVSSRDASSFERPVSAAAGAEDAAGATPRAVAERFYDAFVNRRFDEMESLYAENVTFQDDIFRYRDRAGTMGMWRKLLRDPDNVTATYRFERMEGNVAIGRWQADYEVFGRKVHNDIESRLTIENGRIVAHRDDFDFTKWARQALPIGPLASVPGVKPVLAGLLRLVVG